LRLNFRAVWRLRRDHQAGFCQANVSEIAAGLAELLDGGVFGAAPDDLVERFQAAGGGQALAEADGFAVEGLGGQQAPAGFRRSLLPRQIMIIETDTGRLEDDAGEGHWDEHHQLPGLKRAALAAREVPDDLFLAEVRGEEHDGFQDALATVLGEMSQRHAVKERIDYRRNGRPAR